MKIGRNEFEIDKNDVIFDNSCCYQLMTKKIGFGLETTTPVVAKALFKRLLNQNIIYLLSEELKSVTDSGKEMWHRYYKFDVAKLETII